MASTRELKNRINSVSNTRQITKAMQLVSANKMHHAYRKSQLATPYAEAIKDTLDYLSSQKVVKNHPYFAKRDIKSRLIIVVSSDKGLAGVYNNSVVKRYLELADIDKNSNIKDLVITIGKKAGQFINKIKDDNLTVIGSYDNLSEDIISDKFEAILETAKNYFLEKKVDQVDVIYTSFINSLKQLVIRQKLLPIIPDTINDNDRTITYEPNPTAVLDVIAYKFTRYTFFKILIDSKASEHSMRMFAMKNATDNANNLISDFTIAMNKARQEAITREITEISAGVEALKQ